MSQNPKSLLLSHSTGFNSRCLSVICVFISCSYPHDKIYGNPLKDLVPCPFVLPRAAWVTQSGVGEEGAAAPPACQHLQTSIRCCAQGLSHVGPILPAPRGVLPSTPLATSGEFGPASAIPRLLALPWRKKPACILGNPCPSLCLARQNSTLTCALGSITCLPLFT